MSSLLHGAFSIELHDSNFFKFGIQGQQFFGNFLISEQEHGFLVLTLSKTAFDDCSGALVINFLQIIYQKVVVVNNKLIVVAIIVYFEEKGLRGILQ
jgi:hypothetical protein